MKIAGIICEYNPMHLGHSYQIEETKKILNTDAIIAIMSGNVMQRGEFPIANKFKRAENAIRNGIDLVIELPAYFSLQSAQFFAEGAVEILSKIRVCDFISFGSESGDINKLQSILQIYNHPDFKLKLKYKLKSGLSYNTALNQIYGELKAIETPLKSNDILALEYLKALKKTNIKPISIKRKGSGHTDLSLKNKISSASAIRKAIDENNFNIDLSSYLPKTSIEMLTKYYKKVNYEKVFDIIKYFFLIKKQDVKNIVNYEEGLENRIKSAILLSKNYEDFLDKTISKRYSKNRIRRFLLNCLLGVNNELNLDYAIKNIYLRPLATNHNGLQLLKEIKKNSDIKIISKFSKDLNNSKNSLLDLELKTTNLYAIASDLSTYNSDHMNTMKIIS